MSFNARLSLNGKEFNVIHCSYSLRRDVDPTGRPSSMPYGGTVQLEIESSGDSKSIFEWMIDPYKKQGGSVKFMRKDTNAKMKELKWEDGYCVQFTESLEAFSERPMSCSFVISARVLSVDGSKHENEWPKSA